MAIEDDGQQMIEVAPGVHRIPFAIGTKPMAMYIVEGDRLILVDTGLFDTPETIYLPAIQALGRRRDEVALVVITHADADHIGGNSAVRALFPNALIACHAHDGRWVSDPATITAERYDGFRDYGLCYDDAVFAMLASWMGPPEPVDLMLHGREWIRRTGDDWLVVTDVPGHTPGHICLHNPLHGYAIIGDAIFGRSQLDTAGNWSAPPPYTSVERYLTTIETIAGFDLDLLLTCHYPVMRGEEIRRFIDASHQFVDLASRFTERLLRKTSGSLTLAAAIEAADPLLGPYRFARDLQFSLLAHLDHEVAHGRARRVEADGIVAWEAVRR
ncbi:MAG: MBL fold metallo-hydrolase [Chloroflexia bacterium]|nr:MBL fold metallo-hydrolase [Chloroflexia bacterium]